MLARGQGILVENFGSLLLRRGEHTGSPLRVGRSIVGADRRVCPLVCCYPDFRSFLDVAASHPVIGLRAVESLGDID